MKQQTVTKKQLKILLFLYYFRFLDTPTIQLLLRHKLPTRIQQWLQDVTRKGYIHQFYDRTSFVERTKPAMYCLSTKARQILKDQDACEQYILQQLYREKTRSEQFRHHCCYIAKFYLHLKENMKTTEGKETLNFYTKVLLYGNDHFPQPLPDAYFEIKRKEGETKRYFVELFEDRIPKRALKFKIQRYFTCKDNGEWDVETNNTPFPDILLIAQNKYRQRKLKRIVQQIQDEEYSELSFYHTNKEKIKEQGLCEEVWEKVE